MPNMSVSLWYIEHTFEILSFFMFVCLAKLGEKMFNIFGLFKCSTFSFLIINKLSLAF